MTAKCLLNQLTKISCLNVLKYNGYTVSSTGLAKTAKPVFIDAKKVYWPNFVKDYCTVINNIPIVSYEYVKQLKKHPDILLIDVREPQELQETGQIPTSINIPLGQVAEELGSNVDNGVFKAKYGRTKPEKNTEIIFHCRIGRRSQNAAELAKSLGYKNAKNYLGSWTEWAEKEGLSK